MASAYFLAVRAVINDEDPVGLLQAGAPVDEYDPEVACLVEGQASVNAQRVHEVFEHFFGEVSGVRFESAARIATGINRARVEHRTE